MTSERWKWYVICRHAVCEKNQCLRNLQLCWPHAACNLEHARAHVVQRLACICVDGNASCLGKGNPYETERDWTSGKVEGRQRKMVYHLFDGTGHWLRIAELVHVEGGLNIRATTERNANETMANELRLVQKAISPYLYQATPIRVPSALKVELMLK